MSRSELTSYRDQSIDLEEIEEIETQLSKISVLTKEEPHPVTMMERGEDSQTDSKDQK